MDTKIPVLAAAMCFVGVGCAASVAPPVVFEAKHVVFEANEGQAPSDVEFIAHAARYRVFLTRTGAVVATNDGETLRVDLTGAKAVTPEGSHRLAGKSNYLAGSDRAQWRTGIPNFGEVRYGGVYPGIDVVWHERKAEVEYDFLVAAGADPRRIRIEMRGAKLVLSADGDLTAGSVRFHKPRAYQDGREIECRYQVRGRTVRFVLGDYDRARPLTIDPLLSFTRVLDVTGSASVALDPTGNIVVAGLTTFANFPISPGVIHGNPNTSRCGAIVARPCPNIFITKWSPDGTLLFSTSLGGSGQIPAPRLALDPAGNIYLAGLPFPNFPTLTPLPGRSLYPSGPYVIKISADGSSVIYATMLPLDMQASLTGLAVDAAGAAYVTGQTNGELETVSAFQGKPARASVFKTTDSGANWQVLPIDVPRDSPEFVAVDPTNPQTIYYGVTRALYKSVDAGAHWTALQNGLPAESFYPTIAIDRSRPQTLYLGAVSGGFYKSTDGGANWTTSGTGVNAPVRQIAIDPKSPSTLYLATDAGLYKSTDGAASWSLTGLMAGPQDNHFVRTVVVDPVNPATLYAGTSKGVMKSTDGAKSWTALTDGFAKSLDILGVTIDPVNPQALYATITNTYAIYRTTDGGAHWIQGALPSLNSHVNSLLVDPFVHTTVYAGSDDGILVSRDSGATWNTTGQRIQGGVGTLVTGSDGTIYAIAAGSLFAPDAYALKLDPSGSKIVYATFLGGFGSDEGNAIAVDRSGRAYITGSTDSFDSPVAGALQPRKSGLLDAFVTVLDPTGSRLVWSTYLGGSDDERAYGIAVDPSGNVHLAGWTVSRDFPLRQAFQSRFAESTEEYPTDAFVTKIKSDGSALIFSTYLGGGKQEFAYGVASDPLGNTYITGSTQSSDLPAVAPIQTALADEQDAFVAALDGLTGAAKYVTYFGSPYQNAIGTSIAADAAGNAYIAGGSSFFGSGGFLAKILLDAGPPIALKQVVDAASYAGRIAPGGLVSLFGTSLSQTTTAVPKAPLPITLSDVQVMVNGTAAPLLYVSPGQVNAQIPFETGTGAGRIEVTSPSGKATLDVTVSETAPAIFTMNSRGTGAGAIEHGLTYQFVTGANPAVAGEIVSIYCTGLGAVIPYTPSGAAAQVPPAQTAQAVHVSIAGALAEVSYAGLAPGFAGLYQVNAQIPLNTPAGDQTVQISVGGAVSNSVTMAVR